MGNEPVNHPLFRAFCFMNSVPFSLVGSLLIYMAIDQWIRCYGRVDVWIIFPSEILAPVGGALLLFGFALFFLTFRPRVSWSVRLSPPDPP